MYGVRNKEVCIIKKKLEIQIVLAKKWLNIMIFNNIEWNVSGMNGVFVLIQLFNPSGMISLYIQYVKSVTYSCLQWNLVTF